MNGPVGSSLCVGEVLNVSGDLSRTSLYFFRFNSSSMSCFMTNAVDSSSVRRRVIVVLELAKACSQVNYFRSFEFHSFSIGGQTRRPRSGNEVLCTTARSLVAIGICGDTLDSFIRRSCPATRINR